MDLPKFSTLNLSLADGIAEIRLNRPEKSNAMNDAMWQEIRQAFAWIDHTPQARVAILSGEGKNFCAGIDLAMLAASSKKSLTRTAHAAAKRCAGSSSTCRIA
jgi:enoyl-CoA hydratase